MLKKICLVLGYASITTILSGCVFKINKHEDNALISVSHLVDKVILTSSTFQTMKPKIGQNFVYKNEKTTFKQPIINILENDAHYEVFLNKEHHSINNKKIKTINYFVKKVSFWNNLFNTGGD